MLILPAPWRRKGPAGGKYGGVAVQSWGYSDCRCEPDVTANYTGAIELPLRDRDPLVAWTYKPASFQPERPMVIVMHGVARNARAYRDAWIPSAEKYGALVVAPEFSKTGFPTPREYEVGNMRDRDRHPLPRENWTLSLIELLFDRARQLFGTTRAGYCLFGHSAGAQFAHRLLTYLPDHRVERAVVANAGCYTFLDPDERFPYGLRGMPLDRAGIARMLAHGLTVLLGECDADPAAPQLLRSPEAMRQGEHRLARGRSYFAHGQRLAARLGVPFGWRLLTVPGVGHSQRAMAPHAAQVLFGRERLEAPPG